MAHFQSPDQITRGYIITSYNITIPIIIVSVVFKSSPQIRINTSYAESHADINCDIGTKKRRGRTMKNSYPPSRKMMGSWEPKPLIPSVLHSAGRQWNTYMMDLAFLGYWCCLGKQRKVAPKTTSLNLNKKSKKHFEGKTILSNPNLK